MNQFSNPTARRDVGDLSQVSDVTKKPAGGTKYDGGKPRMDLLVPEAEIQTAKVFGFGSQKYGDYNWQAGIRTTRLQGALRRHLAAWAAGEDLDPESGLPHLAHASCNIQMLIWMCKHRPELDDRAHKIREGVTSEDS